MGNCIQTQRATNTASEPKRLSHVSSESVMIEIPIQETTVNAQHPTSEIVVVKPQTREPSSKEEVFYDSNLSIDSDYEDFYSANGDTTPSLDDNPIIRSRAGETDQLEKSIPIDGTTDTQREPTSNKLLIEYLDQENFNSDGNQISLVKPDQPANLPPNSADKSSYASLVNLCRGKETQNKTRSNPTKENAKRPAKSCLPSLVQSLSFSQKKKALNSA